MPQLLSETDMIQQETAALLTRVLRWREGSHVRRCHTTPYVGDYTVGKHSHDTLSLLYALWPGGHPPGGLVRAVHFHDIAERQIGDIPANVKNFCPSLADELSLAEIVANRRLGLEFLEHLTEEESEWLRAVDALELWLWCCDQVNMGNRNVDEIMEKLEAWFDEWELPDPVRKFYESFQWSRELVVWEGS